MGLQLILEVRHCCALAVMWSWSKCLVIHLYLQLLLPCTAYLHFFAWLPSFGLCWLVSSPTKNGLYRPCARPRCHLSLWPPWNPSTKYLPGILATLAGGTVEMFLPHWPAGGLPQLALVQAVVQKTWGYGAFPSGRMATFAHTCYHLPSCSSHLLGCLPESPASFHVVAIWTLVNVLHDPGVNNCNQACHDYHW